MEPHQFKKIKCPVCHQDISTAGAAYTAHMRAHARRGEVIEHKQGKHLRFILGTAGQYVEAEPYAKLGEEPLPGQPKGVWVVPSIDIELPALSPSSYFITSGEAVKKADKLVRDLYSLAVKARAFRDKLQRARGSKKYLETCREAGKLLVKVKEPRQHDLKEPE